MKGRLEELIHIFEDVANNPKKMVAEYKKEVGKEVIGVMPVYAPEEIIHAAGCLPIGLWGGKKKFLKQEHIYLLLHVLLCKLLWNYKLEEHMTF
ncbi:hypothetical protein HMPREF9466_02776 [Fusobacterium necrophorum subsp. funduliforme 1_1_36S]|nr:hypothetical protein HMPREF9466_02776 [Fusobacterium necrophorum subsp. funduliforme 1_1_36S]